MRNMGEARQLADGFVRWVEVCYCPTPLQEERTYWEEYFEITRIQDAHDRRRCRDLNGSEPWACDACDCTARLQNRLNNTGAPFLDRLRSEVEFQKGRPSGSFSGAPATPLPLYNHYLVEDRKALQDFSDFILHGSTNPK